jgi:hypothetical protein
MVMTPDSLETDGVTELSVAVDVDESFTMWQQNRQTHDLWTRVLCLGSSCTSWNEGTLPHRILRTLSQCCGWVLSSRSRKIEGRVTHTQASTAGSWRLSSSWQIQQGCLVLGLH